MTTEQWERENQDTLMEYFIDGDPSVRRIQCEYCRKIIYTQTRNRKYCSFQTCGRGAVLTDPGGCQILQQCLSAERLPPA